MHFGKPNLDRTYSIKDSDLRSVDIQGVLGCVHCSLKVVTQLDRIMQKVFHLLAVMLSP